MTHKPISGDNIIPFPLSSAGEWEKIRPLMIDIAIEHGVSRVRAREFVNSFEATFKLFAAPAPVRISFETTDAAAGEFIKSEIERLIRQFAEHNAKLLTERFFRELSLHLSHA